MRVALLTCKTVSGYLVKPLVEGLYTPKYSISAANIKRLDAKDLTRISHFMRPLSQVPLDSVSAITLPKHDTPKWDIHMKTAISLGKRAVEINTEKQSVMKKTTVRKTNTKTTTKLKTKKEKNAK